MRVANLIAVSITYGYRLYRGEEFCRLEIGLYSEHDAVQGAADAMAGGWYTRADITENGAVIGHIDKDLQYGPTVLE